MVQDIFTIIIVIAAVSYSMTQAYRLFRKPRKGKMPMICSSGCVSCELKKNTCLTI